MDGLRDETGDPVVIARNRLVIATREGNPDRVEELKDLADPKLKVVLADDTVPVGRYAKQVLDRQRIEVRPVSKEANVRSVLSSSSSVRPTRASSTRRTPPPPPTRSTPSGSRTPRTPWRPTPPPPSRAARTVLPPPRS
ncbi:hypothetical protein SALBM135S_06378 [Streptomyces alboniger]